MFLLLIGWTPMNEFPQCLNLNPHTGFQPIYLHNDPLVLLFGEVYEIHVVVNEVFQTAMKISVWPNWPLRIEGLVCSHTHLCIVRKKKHKQNTLTQSQLKIEADNIWMFFCFCLPKVSQQKQTLSWSQWVNVSGICTHSVFLSTVRLRWVPWCSTVMWCQCWSSNRLPRDTWCWLIAEELLPGEGWEGGQLVS